MASYNFKLLHKPGNTNVKADFLSRPPGLNKGVEDNKDTVLLPENLFVFDATAEESYILDEYHFQDNYNEAYTIDYQSTEYIFESLPENIAERLSHIKMDTYDTVVKNGLHSKDDDFKDHGNGLITYKERIYIPPNHSLRTDIIKEHHDSTSAGHPGRYKTQELITRDYWWP